MKMIYCLLCLCLLGQLPMVFAADEAEVITEVSVSVGKITHNTLLRYVQAYGVVEPEPSTAHQVAASAKVAAPLAGIVSQVSCVEGQTVTKGQLLFALDSRTADALLAKARVVVDFANKNFARKQQLQAADNISRKLYDEAEQALQTARKDLLNAQTQCELLKITAPLAGTVTVCHVKAGEAVSLNAVLAEVIDLHRLDVVIHVPSVEATALRLQQTVRIATQLHGKVTFISPQVDPLTDTVLVRVSLPADANLRAGQLVNVAIVVEKRDSLAVPIDSIVTKNNISYLAIVTGNQAKQQVVTVGLRDDKLIAVQGEGLHEDMTIVTQGSYGLPPESRIRILP